MTEEWECTVQCVCVCVWGGGERRGGEKGEGGKDGEDIFHCFCFYSSPFSSHSVFSL